MINNSIGKIIAKTKPKLEFKLKVLMLLVLHSGNTMELDSEGLPSLTIEKVTMLVSVLGIIP